MARGNSEAFIKEGNFICECGKSFTKSQSFYAHQSHCKIHLGDRYDLEKHKGWNVGDARAWSRGLTKETDPRIQKQIASAKIYYEQNGGCFRGKTHSEETKSILSERAKYNVKHRLNGWKSGNNRVHNKYEDFTEKFLIDNNVPYKSEVVVTHSSLGKLGSYYQLDFLVDDIIDLEIDGSSHNEEHDNIRDIYISQKYKVYRIKHNDSIEELEIKLKEFLLYLSQEGSEHQYASNGLE